MNLDTNKLQVIKVFSNLSSDPFMIKTCVSTKFSPNRAMRDSQTCCFETSYEYPFKEEKFWEVSQRSIVNCEVRLDQYA